MRRCASKAGGGAPAGECERDRRAARAKSGAGASAGRPPEREVSDDSCSPRCVRHSSESTLPGRPHAARDVESSCASRCCPTTPACVDGTAAAKRKGKKRKSRESTGSCSRSASRASAEAYQRPVIRKKIAELIEYYNAVRREPGTCRPFPGAVLLVADRRLEFNADQHAPRPRRACRSRPRRACCARSTASTACSRAPPADRRRTAPSDVQVPGGDLRPAGARSGRRAVRHHQRQAHEAEPVAPDQPRGPAALSRQGARRRATTSSARSTRTPSSPLHGEIKLFGVGRGASRRRRSPRSCKQHLHRRSRRSAARDAGSRSATHAQRFFLNYFKQVAQRLRKAWARPQIQHQDRHGAARLPARTSRT